jgi:hypothetical protein
LNYKNDDVSFPMVAEFPFVYLWVFCGFCFNSWSSVKQNQIREVY